MTRKDYILISRAMRRSFLNEVYGNDAQYIHSCNCLASDLMFDNPRFDRIRFLRDCGLNTDFPLSIDRQAFAEEESIG